MLFLDELPEWDRHVLEVLREPLESGEIHVSRAARQAKFPAISWDDTLGNMKMLDALRESIGLLYDAEKPTAHVPTITRRPLQQSLPRPLRFIPSAESDRRILRGDNPQTRSQTLPGVPPSFFRLSPQLACEPPNSVQLLSLDRPV